MSPTIPVPPQSKDSIKTPFASAFSFSLPAAWFAIGILWIVTPLSYLFVLWHLITLSPTLAPYRPAQQGPLRVIDYVILAYCAIEIPFSIYYRYLAYASQKRRTDHPVYTRKFLRSIFKQSLENGLKPRENEEEEAGQVAGNAVRRNSIVRRKSTRQKKSATGAESSETYLNGVEKEDAVNSSMGTLVNGHIKRKYEPSFIETPLGPDDPRALDFQSHIRLWFHDIEYDQIHKQDMLDWLSWSLYARPYEELLAERNAWEKDGRPEIYLEGVLDGDDEGIDIEQDKLGLVEHCLDLVEARAGKTFPEGRNKDIKVIRLTLDPVRVAQRPFILYAFVWAAQKLVIGNAWLQGFRRHREGSTNYIIRIPPGWTPSTNAPESQQPLLFIHGLGMGLVQYMSLLLHLGKAKNLQERPIIVLVQPHISMSFFEKEYLNPPENKSTVTELLAIAKKWKFDQSGMTVLSHSNGTMVHGWLVKAAPDLVKRSCFVDPVCFCLWEPFVAYGFLYSTPKTPIEYLMRYFVGRELGIANTLSRYFDWSSNLLFPHQIPRLNEPYYSAFFLSGRDSILNATRIRRYLREAGIKEVKKGENVGESRGGMKTHLKNKHGESLIGSGRAFLQIMAWVSGELDDRTQAPDSDSDGVVNRTE